MILTCLTDISSALQALAAVSIAFLTGWTLKVLREYARDTKRIAQHGEEQLEHAQMPFLGVVMKPGGDGRIGGYYIHNQGFGPALNITFTCTDGTRARFARNLPSLAAGDDHFAHGEISNTFDSGDSVEIEYSSLSGKWYRTVVNRAGGRVQTEFHKL